MGAIGARRPPLSEQCCSTVRSLPPPWLHIPTVARLWLSTPQCPHPHPCLGATSSVSFPVPPPPPPALFALATRCLGPGVNPTLETRAGGGRGSGQPCRAARGCERLCRAWTRRGRAKANTRGRVSQRHAAPLPPGAHAHTLIRTHTAAHTRLTTPGPAGWPRAGSSARHSHGHGVAPVWSLLCMLPCGTS